MKVLVRDGVFHLVLALSNKYDIKTILLLQTSVLCDNIKTEHTFSKEERKDEITEQMSLLEKLNILSDAAKYDVACTSSGVDRQNDGNGIGTVRRLEFVIVFQQMEDVFHYENFVYK